MEKVVGKNHFEQNISFILYNYEENINMFILPTFIINVL